VLALVHLKRWLVLVVSVGRPGGGAHLLISVAGAIQIRGAFSGRISGYRFRQNLYDSIPVRIHG
jgi:hypothetical protein